MADCPSFSDLNNIAVREALTRNSRLRRAVLERAGTDANALVAAGVAPADAVMGRLIRYNADLYLDSARGAALDKLVWDRYKLLRQAASPAILEASITSSSPVAAAFDIPVGTVFTTANGRVYNATEAVTFPLGSSGPITVPIQSALTGLSQQVAIGGITTMVLASAPAGLTVTNTEASAGAADDEEDDHLRDRGKRYYTTAQRGTLPAIERRALEVAGVRSAVAFEAIDGDGSSARLVEVMVTDQYTDQLADASALPGGYQTQSQLLANTIKSALSDTRAAGIPVTVTLAQIRLLGVTLLLRYRPGVNVSAVNNAARALVVAYTNGLDPGETWSVSVMQSLLMSVPGLIVLGGEVVSPSLDQPNGQLQAWRTNLSLVTIGNV